MAEEITVGEVHRTLVSLREDHIKPMRCKLDEVADGVSNHETRLSVLEDRQRRNGRKTLLGAGGITTLLLGLGEALHRWGLIR